MTSSQTLTSVENAPLGFQMRPAVEQQVKTSQVKQLIGEVLSSSLSGESYTEERTPELCKIVSDRLQRALGGMSLQRYKLVVHTVIGEQRGAGVKVGAKCLWDADTDKYVSDVFISDTLFCVATVYIVYYY